MPASIIRLTALPPPPPTPTTLIVAPLADYRDHQILSFQCDSLRSSTAILGASCLQKFRNRVSFLHFLLGRQLSLERSLLSVKFSNTARDYGPRET